MAGNYVREQIGRQRDRTGTPGRIFHRPAGSPPVSSRPASSQTIPAPARENPTISVLTAIALHRSQERNTMQRQAAKDPGRSPVLKKLAAQAPAIRSRFGVTRIGIFGSCARGEQTKKSDVDVLADFAPGYANMRNFIGLCDCLEELFRQIREVRFRIANTFSWCTCRREKMDGTGQNRCRICFFHSSVMNP
ncbi:MAG: Nucleotidyltransferase domain protein [Methanoregula sp. PtaU1.Bin051]|nr:MAG: Nucleotidyltransferase domain protein [Methanoregula sp. PtaU1.Bin051]